jgi:hypothetical protein
VALPALLRLLVYFVEHIAQANPEARHDVTAVKRLLRRDLGDAITLVDPGVAGLRVHVPEQLYASP